MRWLVLLLLVFSLQAAEYKSFAQIMLDSSKGTANMYDEAYVLSELSSVEKRLPKNILKRIGLIDLDIEIKSDACRKAIITYVFLLRQASSYVSNDLLSKNLNNAIYQEFSYRLNHIEANYANSYSLQDPSFEQLHRLKNALSLEYLFERAIRLAKDHAFSRNLSKIMANLDILIGMDGQWNDLAQTFRSFEEDYSPAPISKEMVDTQVLMAFIDNGPADNWLGVEYWFMMRMALAFMKSHVTGKLKDIYRNIYFYFSGDGSTVDNEDGYEMVSSYLHPGSHYYAPAKEGEFVEDTYTQNILQIEKDPTISNVDFYWQAHGADSPFNNLFDTISLSKIRYVNNTWCDGSELYKGSFSKIAKWAKYSPGAGEVNNPFPFNFAINFFTKYNLPVSLSEVLSRLTQETLYHQLLSVIAPNSDFYVGVKDFLFTYTSWFDRYGRNNFVLADSHFKYENDSLFSVSDDYIFQPTPSSNVMFDPSVKGYPLTPFLQGLVSPLLSFMGISDAEEITLKEPSVNKVLGRFINAISTTLIIFSERDIVKSKYSGWDVFPLDSTLIKELRTIALSDDLDECEDLFQVMRYFVSKIDKGTIRSAKNENALQLNLTFDQPIGGRSPILSEMTMGLVSGFQTNKSLQINLSLVGGNIISLKLHGFKVITTPSASIEVPEIIINLEKGTWQILRSGLPIFTVDLSEI